MDDPVPADVTSRERPVGEISLVEVFVTSAAILLRRAPFFIGSAMLPLLVSTAFCCCGVGASAVLLGIEADAADAGETGEWVGVVIAATSMLVFSLVSIVPLGMQIHAVRGFADGERVSIAESLRAMRPVMTSFVPVSVAYGFGYLVSSAMCWLPGLVFAGFLGFAPIVTVTEGAEPEDAFSRGLALSRRLGGLVFAPGLVHGLSQLALFFAFALTATAIEISSAENIEAVIAVEGIYAIIAWVLFTYGAIVVPVVLYARAVGPRRAVPDLEEVFR